MAARLSGAYCPARHLDPNDLRRPDGKDATIFEQLLLYPESAILVGVVDRHYLPAGRAPARLRQFRKKSRHGAIHADPSRLLRLTKEKEILVHK